MKRPEGRSSGTGRPVLSLEEDSLIALQLPEEGCTELFSPGPRGRVHGNDSELCPGSFKLAVMKRFFTEKVVKPWHILKGWLMPKVCQYLRHLDNALNML